LCGNIFWAPILVLLHAAKKPKIATEALEMFAEVPLLKKKNNTKLNRKKANKRKQEKYAYAPEHPRSAHWPPHFSPLPATPAHSLAHFLHIIIRCCFARAIRFAKLLYLIWPASCVHLPSRSHAL